MGPEGTKEVAFDKGYKVPFEYKLYVIQDANNLGVQISLYLIGGRNILNMKKTKRMTMPMRNNQRRIPMRKKSAPENKLTKNEMILKIILNNDNCISEIPKVVLKFKGVDCVNLDKDKDLVMVKGVIDASQIMQYLRKYVEVKCGGDPT